MPTFEHSIIVAQPLKQVATALASGDVDSRFAPSIVRITLDASADGQAADLTYEQLRTTATRPANHTKDEHEHASQFTVTFVGRGVNGTLDYRLVPHDTGTELVQYGTYEFTEWAAIDLLEPATTAHNEQQFAVHLTTVANLVDAESRAIPEPGGAVASEPPVSPR